MDFLLLLCGSARLAQMAGVRHSPWQATAVSEQQTSVLWAAAGSALLLPWEQPLYVDAIQAQVAEAEAAIAPALLGASSPSAASRAHVDVLSCAASQQRQQPPASSTPSHLRATFSSAQMQWGTAGEACAKEPHPLAASTPSSSKAPVLSKSKGLFAYLKQKRQVPSAAKRWCS
jgi:hypothetical protein